jgi:hypothetical protein
MRGTSRFLLAGISIIACCWLIPARLPTLGPTASAWDAPPPVEELIRDLGSNEFEVRDRATKLLKDREDEARGLLQRALGSSDLEIAHRAKELLEFYDTRFLLHRVKRIVQFSKRGQVDLMVDGITSLGQGQLQLNRYSGKDFQQKVVVPATTAAFHHDAVAAGVLLQQ